MKDEIYRRIREGTRKLKVLHEKTGADFVLAGIRQSELSDILHGRRNPTFDRLVKIASVFNMDFEEFVWFCKITDGVGLIDIARTGINYGAKIHHGK